MEGLTLWGRGGIICGRVEFGGSVHEARSDKQIQGKRWCIYWTR